MVWAASWITPRTEVVRSDFRTFRGCVPSRFRAHGSGIIGEEMAGARSRGRWIDGQLVRLRIGRGAQTEIVSRLRGRGRAIEQMGIDKFVERQRVSPVAPEVVGFGVIDLRDRTQCGAFVRSFTG